jgi:general secretion pathway protein F
LLVSKSKAYASRRRALCRRIVALAIPIITITMGLGVAGIVGALLTALLSLNDLAV